MFGSHQGLGSPRRGARAGAPVPGGLLCGAGVAARGDSGDAWWWGGQRRTKGGVVVVVVGALVRRLRGRSCRPRAAIITEPPFSGWLCLE